MFYKKWIQGKPKQIAIFRDTNYLKAQIMANEWIVENNIEVIDISFEFPFVIVKHWGKSWKLN